MFKKISVTLEEAKIIFESLIELEMRLEEQIEESPEYKMIMLNGDATGKADISSAADITDIVNPIRLADFRSSRLTLLQNKLKEIEKFREKITPFLVKNKWLTKIELPPEKSNNNKFNLN